MITASTVTIETTLGNSDILSMADSHSNLPLPPEIISTYLHSPSNNLTYHILSCGSDSAPLLLFCHGFPDLAYSWRKILSPLASHGYHCIAFDQRGYGRTIGHDTRSYEELNLHEFGPVQNIIDVLALVALLGRKQVDVIIGHDFGATTAANCSLARPDVFKACILMSHPFEAIPSFPGPESPSPLSNVSNDSSISSISSSSSSKSDIQAQLAAKGRKHYKWANSTSTAAEEWNHPSQGLKSFLRGYYFLKSASDSRNNPHPLSSWTAEELIGMPHYYIPKLHLSMAQTVAEDTASIDLAASYSWLSDEELDVYVAEWERTGFLPALSWYRSRTKEGENEDMGVFAGKKIVVPTVFISGDKDWGNWQKPSALEGMRDVCSDFRGVRLIEGAGHWVQMEKWEEVVKEVGEFVGDVMKR